MGGLETRVSSLLNELEQARKDAGDFRIGWQAGRSEREQIVGKIADKETEIRALESQVEEMRETEKTLRRKIEESERARVAAANLPDVESIKSSAGSAQIQLDQLHAVEAERDALKTELEAVKAGLERTKQHVNVLQSRRDQMRDEIARLKVALGQAPDAMG
jgi:chromosome segregation ATPase